MGDKDGNDAGHQVAKTAQDAESDEEGRHDDVGDAREVPAAICDATDDDVDSKNWLDWIGEWWLGKLWQYDGTDERDPLCTAVWVVPCTDNPFPSSSL